MGVNPFKRTEWWLISEFYLGKEYMVRLLTSAALILMSSFALGASMNKCVDAAGHTTFTNQACAGGLAGERIKVSSATEGMRLASPQEAGDPAAESSRPSRELVAVGGSGASACGGGSDQEIRSAIVKNEVFAGMTAKQATQSWGQPSEINRSSDGTDQWVYYRGDARMQFLYVDSAGCVTGWN